MNEIIQINLDNEMDLILAHKRTMKLAELCGLSTSSQTTFATAVSEIARCAINVGEKSHLVLGINSTATGKKEICAILFDHTDLSAENSEAFSFAKRLMGELVSKKKGEYYEICLRHLIPFSGTISDMKIKSLKEYFKNESPISPYDEIRKKNIQLIDLSNKLKESEKQYLTLTDTLPLMMFSINQKGEVNYSNKWHRDFFGLTATRVTAVTWQSLIHPDDKKLLWKMWDKAQVEKNTFRAEARLRDKNQNYIWHLVTIVPIKNDLGVSISSIGFFVDINSQKLVEETLKDNKELKTAQSDLKLYQAQLEEKINELNNSNKNLEQFAFIASHDLQEPLRKIKTFANLLETDLKLNENQTRYLTKIQDASNRMSNLIRDVLNFSKLSEVDIRYEETDLNEVVESIKIDFELLITEREAIITTTNLPVLKVVPIQMVQLFSNLIHNSIKFCEKKPVINISSREMDKEEVKANTELNPNNRYFHIKLTDNGIGFSQSYSERIFTIFQRLGQVDTEGTGIGLALCKKITENHGGIISAASEAGKGATFNIFLPIDSAKTENANAFTTEENSTLTGQAEH